MNLLLFQPDEITRPLPRADARAQHLLTTLRREIGDTFDTGIANGPRGKGTLLTIGPETLTFSFAWGAPPPPLEPIGLIIGLPRPQTARDILRDATTLGVDALHFVRTDKGDPNYARSGLWVEEEWRRHVLAGAEQAFDTRLPTVTHSRQLAEVVAALPAGGSRLALDNYESPAPLSAKTNLTYHVSIAVGPERGWSAEEREMLRRSNFEFVHLGSRVLRTETAVVAALALVRGQLGLM